MCLSVESRESAGRKFKTASRTYHLVRLDAFFHRSEKTKSCEV